MCSLLLREEEKATSMVEKDTTNERTTYRKKGLELKHEDSNQEHLNISYAEQGRGVFILNNQLNVLQYLKAKRAVKMFVSKSL